MIVIILLRPEIRLIYRFIQIHAHSFLEVSLARRKKMKIYVYITFLKAEPAFSLGRILKLKMLS